MPKGYYNRRQTQQVDHRQILSLLPGRLIVKQLIDREIALIRSSIERGQHREYLALLPGLELEEQRVNSDLGIMGEMMTPPVKGDGADKGTGQGTNGVQLLSEMPLLAAPDEEERKKRPYNRRNTTNTTNGVLDASTILARAFIDGKPALSLLLLKDLMEYGSVNRKEFMARHKEGMRGAPLDSGAVTRALASLTRDGVKLKRPRGNIVLVSKIAGELPTEEPRGSAKMPVARPVVREIVKTEAVVTRAEEIARKPVRKPHRKIPVHAPGIPRGISQTQYLITAFETNPDHVVDALVAQKDLNAASKDSIQVAISLMRRNLGMNIVTLGGGKYQLVNNKRK